MQMGTRTGAAPSAASAAATAAAGMDADARGQRLWGRVNPSFYPLPLESETAGNYVSHGARAEKVDSTHHLHSCSLTPAVRGPAASAKKAQ